MPVEAEQAPATSVEAEEDVGEPGVEGDIIFDITPTPAPTPLPSFKVGDLITIRTSPILDHNQNIVPDGTRVRFDFRISGEPDITQQFESTTQGGVAFFNYRIESAGGMDVIASSGLATRSETLQINISPEGVMSFFAFTPTPLVSPTPEPTPTATITPTLQPTPTSTPNPFPPAIPPGRLGFWCSGDGDWQRPDMIGLLWWGSSRWGLRSALCALIGGLGAYTYLNLGISGVKDWIQQSGTLYVIEIVVAGY